MDICLGRLISCQTVHHFICGHQISDAGEVVPTHCLWNVTECDGCGLREGVGCRITSVILIKQFVNILSTTALFGQLGFGTWIKQ